jgi:hypothetical protein
MGRGGERAAKSLLVDVAHIRQTLSHRVQQFGEGADLGSGADSGDEPIGIVRFQPFEEIERQNRPFAFDELRCVKEWPVPAILIGPGAVLIASESSP